MVWWEAVLSPALQVLFDKLASGDIKMYLNRWNIKESLLQKLKIVYFTNTVVLDDAEEKQYNSPAIETWLEMLKDAVFEAEDILDELATEILRVDMEAVDTSQTITNQVRTWNFTSLNPFVEGIECRIENVIDKLEYIAKQKDSLGLKGDSRRGKLDMFQRSPSTPLLIESHVFGRDKEKEEILELLLNDGDETSECDIVIVPIIGMGGLGKTTLAQMVYNDRKVDDYFDVKAWACVSDDFDVSRTTKWVLESATKKPSSTLNLELLQENLKRKFNKKKFLVVLDDIWNENYENWNILLIPFMYGARGSKIIVTTRNEEVLSIMNAIEPYRLKEMADAACWFLFRHFAFGKINPDMNPKHKELGRQIMDKCKGLPLALKTLGSLLGSNFDLKCWNKVLNNSIWDFPANKSNILPALILSYHHLPANLKRCFAYCSIFPKDYEFDPKKLVLLWMAEGFMQQLDGSGRMEQVGNEYFSNLLSRSFFQVSTHNKSRYVMHDLINDLAQYVSRKVCINLDDMTKRVSEASLFEKARHVSYIRGTYDVFKKFEVLHRVKWLRTFLPLVLTYEGGYCYLTNKVPYELLPKFKCLRVLSLSSYCINEVPDSLSNLKHLRYLDLSHTGITELPESLCVLYNLQTLMLNDCGSLLELPKDMGNLINLRYLDINRTGLQRMPQGMGKLINLQVLPEFIVGHRIGRSSNVQLLPVSVTGASGNGSNIGELRFLSHLCGKLSLLSLENVTDAWEARRANMTNKQHLTEVLMEWSGDFTELRNYSVEKHVFEMLQPHQGLERLTIKYYGGTAYPTWIGDPSFSKIRFLSLQDCKRCVSLPALGQLPSLKKLFIKGMDRVKRVGVEFYGASVMPFVQPIPSLKVLSFKDMPEWETWSSFIDSTEMKGFPKLRELYVEVCPRLRGTLPNYLLSLTKLVIEGCEMLETSVPRLPNLHGLSLNQCDEVLLGNPISINSLTSLHIGNIAKLTHLPVALVESLVQLEDLRTCDCFDLTRLWKNDNGMQYLPSLRRLVIRSCPLLNFLLDENRSLPTTIEYLELEHCLSLKKLPRALNSLTSLEELNIRECPELIFSLELTLPSTLKGLAIQRCGLQSLSGETTHGETSSLEVLYISWCYLLFEFTGEGGIFPAKLKELTIDHCPELLHLPDSIMHDRNNALRILEIIDCPSLISFPGGRFPDTLTTLTIWSCTDLKTIPEFTDQTNPSLESLRIGDCANLKALPNGLDKLTNLQYLEIDRCPGLVSFPNGGFPVTSLKKVYIADCENLEALPDCMQNLTALEELNIADCPRILSIPNGGLPINLLSLEIKRCANIMPLSEWGLNRLVSLRKFSITGPFLNLSSFPEWLLPPTLISLHISLLPGFESFSNWLPNLTSLEELNIKECHKLHALPIEGLPTTLARLEISGCPLLEKQCEDDFSKIGHIPCIIM